MTFVYAILIALAIVVVLFMLALARVSSEADKRIAQMMQEEKERQKENA